MAKRRDGWSDRFTGIRRIEGKPVAVFAMQGEEFVLSWPSLLDRIANMERDGRDVREERMALAALKAETQNAKMP